MSTSTDSANAVTLTSLRFDNAALRALPIDPEPRNYVRRSVANTCFSRVKPDPLARPKIVALSGPAMRLIDLDARALYGDVDGEPTPAGPNHDGEDAQDRVDEAVAKDSPNPAADFLAGNRPIPGAEYAAACYAGHQFGSFAGQLGDGAAMYIGEVINRAGERWEIQYKGSGLTPYSRDADGRKVLRSSLREFMCSESMHHLGIPTTRSGSLVTSDMGVLREEGNVERCSVITRLAQTFIRLGSFEIFKPRDPITNRAGPSAGNSDLCVKLLNFTIASYAPHLWVIPPTTASVSTSSSSAAAQWDVNNARISVEALSQFPPFPAASVGSSSESPVLTVGQLRHIYKTFLEDVTSRTASLVAHWQAVGFCHGVLNTDNMSIRGLTLDYGPFGFLDYFDNDHICNGSDHDGRYDYKSQPDICLWNCEKLAEAVAFPAFPASLIDPASLPEELREAVAPHPAGGAPPPQTSELRRVQEALAAGVLPLGTAEVKKVYDAEYARASLEIWSRKLGLRAHSLYDASSTSERKASSDVLAFSDTRATATTTSSSLQTLTSNLLYVLHETHADMTHCLRALSQVRSNRHLRLLRQEEEGSAPTSASSSLKQESDTKDRSDVDDVVDNEDGQPDPALDNILSFTSSAAVANARREKSKPREPRAVILNSIEEIKAVMRVHPRLKVALQDTLQEMQSKLTKLDVYQFTKSFTPEEKRARDRKLWRDWLREYRALLDADEAALLLQGRTHWPEHEEALSRGEATLHSTAQGTGVGAASAKASLVEDTFAPLSSSSALEALEGSDPARLRSLLRGIAMRRARIQNASNPKFILRNFIAQQVIQDAEADNYKSVRALLRVLEDPYALGMLGATSTPISEGRTQVRVSEEDEIDALAEVLRQQLSKLPPTWASELCVTCSS